MEYDYQNPPQAWIHALVLMQSHNCMQQKKDEPQVGDLQDSTKLPASQRFWLLNTLAMQ